MNNKEIKEIRKLYSKDRCSVFRLCGCYVNGEKEKLATFCGGLIGMEDEELYKYMELFKKCLSGSLEKNLFNIDIPLDFELNNDAYRLLMGMRESGLGNSGLMDMFYDRIIESYEHTGNYMILAAADTYDVPGRSKLGDVMDDASEEAFTYMLAMICPVELAKAGLSFDPEDGWFNAIDRDWVVGAPEAGFMFPAFNDRSTDIHSALIYAKNRDCLQEGLTGSLFGSELPVTAEEKKNAFGTVVSEVFGQEFSAEDVKSVHEVLSAEEEMIRNEPDMDTQLSKSRIRQLLEKSGADDEQMERFDAAYDELLGNDTNIDIENICSTKKFTIKNESADIRISADRTDLISFEESGGRRRVIIELEGPTEVNGVPV